MQHNLRGGKEWPACYSRSGNEVRIRFCFSLPQRRMVSPATVVAATRSASDSNFRSCKGEWPACSGRRRNGLPHPILFFVAAKENSFACYGRSGNEVRVRFHSSLPRRRMVSPATVVAATRSASDPNFRCREEEWFRLLQS